MEQPCPVPLYTLSGGEPDQFSPFSDVPILQIQPRDFDASRFQGRCGDRYFGSSAPKQPSALEADRLSRCRAYIIRIMEEHSRDLALFNSNAIDPRTVFVSCGCRCEVITHKCVHLSALATDSLPMPQNNMTVTSVLISLHDVLHAIDRGCFGSSSECIDCLFTLLMLPSRVAVGLKIINITLSNA